MALFKRKRTKSERKANRRQKVLNLKEKAKNAAEFAVLNRFAPAMRAAVKAKGLTPQKDLGELAKQFYYNIVKRNSYDESGYLNSLDGDVGVTFGNGSTDYYELEKLKNHVDPVTITAIINGIVSYFRKVKAKKDAGEALTPLQEKAAIVAESADAEGRELARDTIEEETGEQVIKYLPVVLGILGGLVVVFIVIKLLAKK